LIQTKTFPLIMGMYHAHKRSLFVMSWMFSCPTYTFALDLLYALYEISICKRRGVKLITEHLASLYIDPRIKKCKYECSLF